MSVSYCSWLFTEASLCFRRVLRHQSPRKRREPRHTYYRRQVMHSRRRNSGEKKGHCPNVLSVKMVPRHEGAKLRRHKLRDRNNLSGGCAEKRMLQEPDGIALRKTPRSFSQEFCNPLGGRRGKVRHLAIPLVRRMSKFMEQPCVRPQQRYLGEDSFLDLSLRKPGCIGFSCLDNSLELLRSLIHHVSCWFHGRPSRRRSSFARLYNSLITGMRRGYAVLPYFHYYNTSKRCEIIFSALLVRRTN
jgi:hypothetical protein